MKIVRFDTSPNSDVSNLTRRALQMFDSPFLPYLNYNRSRSSVLCTLCPFVAYVRLLLPPAFSSLLNGHRSFGTASSSCVKLTSLLLNVAIMKTTAALSLLLASSASAFAPASMMTVRRRT
jgi:hypothetical protein